MNKTELVAAIAAKEGIEKKCAEKAVNAVVAAITDALANGEKVQLVGFGTFEVLGSIEDALKAGDKVQLIGFGTFEVKERAARTGHNPKTGEAITVPATKIPAFKAGQGLKNLVK